MLTIKHRAEGIIMAATVMIMSGVYYFCYVKLFLELNEIPLIYVARGISTIKKKLLQH